MDGAVETRDSLVLPRRIVRNWWRRESHRLVLADLEEVVDELPRRLLVGTGAYGRMRVDPPWSRSCEGSGVTAEARPTGDAVSRCRGLDARETAAALQLTC